MTYRARPSRRATLATVLVGAFVVLAGLTAVVPVASHAASPTTHDAAAHDRAAGDPRQSRRLYVDPSTAAAQAGRAFAKIAGRAQPLWVTDHYSSPGAARKAVRGYTSRATKAGRTPLVVVYNVPDRDCGMYSSQDDQITDPFYRRWVSQVAKGLKGTEAIVVLEPDAIAFIGNPACTGRGDRLGLIRFATRALTRAGAWVYLDAGHSGWQTPQSMAPLLKKAGVGQARGIATNVANTRATSDEQVYARSVIAELRGLGVPGVRYVVDTSRNGAGPDGPAVGDVCNPIAARLGVAPRMRFDGPYDANLWVKPPGESDGTCNGGPPAGAFYPTGACRLLGREVYVPASRSCRG